MQGLCYLYRQMAFNRIKKALKKPMTYFLFFFFTLEFVVVIQSLGNIIRDFQIDTPKNFGILLSVAIFYLLPGNFISYAKRKGLLFKKSHIQLMLPSPVNPKLPILFVGMLNLWLNLFLAAVMVIVGIVYFHVSPIKMFLYAIVYLVFENLLETGIMILCYGNETLPEKFFKMLTIFCYCLMGIFAVAGFLVLLKEGATFASFVKFLDLPLIQVIPIVGWNIALIRLFFVGPTLLNIICSILFCVSSILLFVLALRFPCTGAYYEDVAAFADTYEKTRKKQKEGRLVFSEQKKKFKKAEVTYKGGGAKAIFYRQLLEYKKTHFFIFGFHTLLSFAAGIAIGIFAFVTEIAQEGEVQRIFFIPGIMAYIIFIFSGYVTKWSKELENPYTYLIPDSNLKKLWYATIIEHIRAFMDAALITIPGAIVLKLSVFQTILIMIFYVCLMANKLYYSILSDYLVGSYLGNVGKQLVKTILQMVVIGFSVGGALGVGLFFGPTVGFFIMIAVTTFFTGLGALGASFAFGKM